MLDLVGGPLGAAVSDVLNFVLAAIGTAVSFLRDVEQDQAATATAFAERSERLSQGSNKIGTILQGFAAIAAGLAVPGAVSKIVGRRSTQVARLPAPTERVVPMRDLPDPSGVTTSAGKRESVDVVDRAVAGKGTEISQKSRAPRQYETTAPAQFKDDLDEARLLSNKSKSNPAQQPDKKLTRTEREAKLDKGLKEVKDEFIDTLTDKNKVGMTLAEATKTAGSLRKNLPRTLPRNIAELRQAVEDIMEAATRQAKLDGFVNKAQNNQLGNMAHRYTEYLLDQLNVALAKGKKKIGVFPEQFLSPRFRRKSEWILSQNKAGWLGIDAVLLRMESLCWL